MVAWPGPARRFAIGLAATALALGAAGLGMCLHAARHGWAVPPRLLLGAGLAAAAALAMVPPFGSGDHLSYAAYGRMAVTGHDPYTTTAAMLARLGDPVARAVQDWRHSPSVYGSVATGFQALAAAAGGRSARLTVFVLSLVNVAAFAGTGLLAHRLARGCRGRQLRAALLWTANPLLLQVLVAGAHVDGQAVFFAVSALALFCLSLRYAPRATAAPTGTPIRGAPATPVTPETALPSAPTPGRLLRCFLIAAGAGAAAGLAFAVKVSLLLVLAGLILAAALALLPRDRHRWQPFAAVTSGLVTGFAVIAAASFLPWGTQALGPRAACRELRLDRFPLAPSPLRTPPRCRRGDRGRPGPGRCRDPRCGCSRAVRPSTDGPGPPLSARAGARSGTAGGPPGRGVPSAAR